MDIQAYLHESLLFTIREQFPDIRFESKEIFLYQPARHYLGDISSSVAFQLSAKTNIPPKQIAEVIYQNFHFDASFLKSDISLSDAAGTGFLNFRFSKEYIHNAIQILAHGHSESAISDPRINQLLRQSGSLSGNEMINAGDLRNLTHPAEISLMRHMAAWYALRLQVTAKRVAAAFEKFYHQCPIHCPDKEITAARLRIVKAAGKIYAGETNGS